jgi:hypothetical protein
LRTRHEPWQPISRAVCDQRSLLLDKRRGELRATIRGIRALAGAGPASTPLPVSNLDNLARDLEILGLSEAGKRGRLRVKPNTPVRREPSSTNCKRL